MEQSSRALASNPMSSNAETQIPDLVKIGAIKTDTLIDVETSILEPVQHSQTQCRFRLENKGILHSNSKLVFKMTNPGATRSAYFPINIGIFSLIENCRISSGGKTLFESRDSNMLTAYESMFLSNEHNTEREIFTTARLMNHNMMYDVNASGAKSRGVYVDTGMDGEDSSDDIIMPSFIELKNGAQFQINLSDLFPFLKFQQLPLYMMSEQVTIELEFSSNAKRMWQDAAESITFDIDTSETKLIADYQYYPESMMEAYANANRSLQLTYNIYRLSKQTIDATGNLKVRNIGGNGRICTNVIASLQDDTLTGVENPLISYSSLAPAGSGTSNGSITLNLKYNNHLLYPIDVDNYAHHQHNTAQSRGMVPFVTRFEYCGEGTDLSVAADTFEGADMRARTKGAFCWQSHRLNRNERVNSRGIEYQATYQTNGGSRTQRIWVESVRIATLQDGRFSTQDA